MNKLKIVAEKLGYKTHESTPEYTIESVWIETNEPLRNWQEFNPEANPAQLVECENYLLEKYRDLLIRWLGDGYEVKLPYKFDRAWVGGSRAEAVINAIWATDRKLKTDIGVGNE